MDVAFDFEQFHVVPNMQADVKIAANVTPSKAWPEEQERFGLDPRMGMPAAIRSLRAGDTTAPLMSEAVCQLDVSAKLFDLIPTGVISISKTIDLSMLSALLYKNENDESHETPSSSSESPATESDTDYPQILQSMFAATHFENITNSLLFGNGVEADLAAAIEILLNETSFSTPSLKEFNIRLAPINVAMGVGSTAVSKSGAPPPPQSVWSISVDAVQFDLQNSKCVESGSVALSAAARSNPEKVTSLLTPASHAFAEMASAGSARFPFKFENHQLWFEFMFGKEHATIARFSPSGVLHNVSDSGGRDRNAREHGESVEEEESI